MARGSVSPEEISRRLLVEFPDDPIVPVSHETIYQSIYVQGRGELRRELARCLRTGGVKRQPRNGVQTRGRMPGMVMISERPAEADDRAVPGHWEGDLIIGKEGAPPSASSWSAPPATPRCCTSPTARRWRRLAWRCEERSRSSRANLPAPSRGTRARRWPACQLQHRHRDPRVLLRSAQPVAATVQREHQRAAAPVHAEAHRPIGAHRGRPRPLLVA